ncbi:MAG: hypothetical protein M1825_000725 [Sarcosagium campestre]|nr:MAG: hypothetical protein M1825_000725 [Sarcosagium campestre]
MTNTPPPPGRDGSNPTTPSDPNPPTIAAFPPSTLSRKSVSNRHRSTILVHQKSPLLVATPPQITRALAYSHPFLLPLNKFVGLVSWTSGDPWESFLLVAAFWAIVLYGDVVVRWTGPVALVAGLIVGMYSRRYSPLSSTGWTGEKIRKNKKKQSEQDEGGSLHHKSLDEIVDTLRVFTYRCNVLLDPLLQLTDFLSTQRTATSTTTRPSLTRMFMRILVVMPVWIVLTLPPLKIITTRRVVLTIGTLILSWHSRPARVSRAILWRSSLVRQTCSTLSGLSFHDADAARSSNGKSRPPPLPPRRHGGNRLSVSGMKRNPGSPGVRFTFILYENQRRWIGLGWNNSLFAYERAPWTDEHLHPAQSKDEFELPEVEGSEARWRWVKGSKWMIEGATDGEAEGSPGSKIEKAPGGEGWIYYDNKWRDGRRDQDGWGLYTRRRKWYRDAELVEVTPSTEITPSTTPNPSTNPNATLSENEGSGTAESDAAGDGDDRSSMRKRRWFRRTSKASTISGTQSPELDQQTDGDILVTGKRLSGTEDWRVGDDTRMGLG